ncbi:MAG: hypothetical protein U9Q77_14025 [Candidatus Marinimicrobia bacterium]|nr:hypothetical protein [Candidatus Neomarinimicrobiota bacterium]
MAFKYTFRLPESKTHEFVILLNRERLTYQTFTKAEPANWTALSYHTCANCPLVEQGVEHCPVAFNLQDIVGAFTHAISYDKVDVSIETEERTYRKNGVTMQSGLSSILGIIMVTSGCPSLDYLRPMVMTHLPFATISESIYRSISMYLLAQFTRAKSGLEPDWTLEGLTQIYARIDKINISMVKRLQAATKQDASLNAVVILDSFAKMIPMTIDGSLKELEQLFWPYLESSFHIPDQDS